MKFAPYVAKDRIFGEYRFDFIIENETAQSWYDGSPNQWMPERGWCVSKLRPGMIVVDCGAHHGMLSTIFAHAVGGQGAVYAYEALPSNAEVIVRNAKMNHSENIRVRPVGVGEENASMAVDFNSSNTVVMSTDRALDGDGIERIRIVRLDDDLPPNIKVDFIKIDVEGHDLSALRGMPRILAQRPMIDLELHNFIFNDKYLTLSEIVAILNPLRYQWELLGEIGGAPVPIGTTLEVAELARFENPHLFGVPQETVK